MAVGIIPVTVHPDAWVRAILITFLGTAVVSAHPMEVGVIPVGPQVVRWVAPQTVVCTRLLVGLTVKNPKAKT